MTASAAMSLVFEIGWLALTPWERWSAASSLSGEPRSASTIIIFLSIALVVLLILFSAASIQRSRKVRKSKRGPFEEYSEESGLSIGEQRLLRLIAEKAGLKRHESIFTIGAAFGRGAAKMVEEAAAGEDGAEAAKHLKTELAFLREKLGFGAGRSDSGEPGRRRSVTTRDIPVGRSLYVTRQKPGDEKDIETKVERNSDTELAVRLSTAVKVIFGEMWCVRYYSGASVWEFDAKAVSYDGDTLVLSHSDNVRFVNRRRFLRVSVRLRAFVARFPFMIGENNTLGEAWAPPRFFPAVVTEMAGPGLRIESELEVEAGERVLVVLNLRGQSDAVVGGLETSGSRVAEGVGQVKYVKASERGYSIAIEMMGLDDSEVDELVRATNAVSLEASEKSEELGLLVGHGA